jgi:prolyl oligopeptidase
VEEQNKLTFGLLEECDYRGKIHDRLKEVYNYPKYSCPFKRGDRFYFFKNDGLQNQSVLYTQETLDAEPTVPLAFSFFFPQACTLRDASLEGS